LTLPTDTIIVVDSNIVLGRCFPPGVDQYADVAREVFAIIERHSAKPCILDTIDSEIESKIRRRFGSIAEACRALQHEVESGPPITGMDPREALDKLTTGIRSALPENGGAISVIERRVEERIRTNPTATVDWWAYVAYQILGEVQACVTEAQKQRELLSLERVDSQSYPKAVNLDKLGLKKDRAHIEGADAFARNRKKTIWFVTFDSPLLAKVERVAAICPAVVVMSPSSLRLRLEPPVSQQSS
jgi:hypothetical protein